MKTNLRYLVFLALALSCGTAMLWVFLDSDKCATKPVRSGTDEVGVNPTFQARPFEANSTEPVPQPALEASEAASPEIRNWASRFSDLANMPDRSARASDAAFSAPEPLLDAASFASVAPANPAWEPVPFPSPEMPFPLLPPMHFYDGPQPDGAARFETVPPSYEAEGRPQSLSSFPGVTDQPNPGSVALPPPAASSASLELPSDLRELSVNTPDMAGVWRLLAQSAVHDTDAAELLVKRASKDEIPYQAWPAIADTLISESLQDGRLVFASATLSHWTEGELNARLALIGALLDVTANKIARQALQEALVRLLSDSLY